ncbi:MAG: WbuC family cupin fold metalloprotein [Gammaproteobacteria bacterium]|nr:WbuC family cupin fold metalloprotein [Gammaproteobacteria bacterium]
MITKFTKEMLDELSREADTLPRRRKNLNLHQNLDDPVQKLFNAMQTDSYVRPHRHPETSKTELFIAVRGSFAIILFDDEGKITDYQKISPAGEVFGAEIKPNTWHTVIALEDQSVFFEVKQGPYTPLSDKDFAAWAPEDGATTVAEFMHCLQQAKQGDQLSSFCI